MVPKVPARGREAMNIEPLTDGLALLTDCPHPAWSEAPPWPRLLKPFGLRRGG